MRIWTYDESDEVLARLAAAKRNDLARHVPAGGRLLQEAQIEFWVDVAARFMLGERADAVTAIERRFEPRKPKKGDAEIIAAARVAA